MIKGYIVVSTALFIFLALIWKKDDLTNFFIKLLLVFLAGYGSILTLMQLGLVLKV